MYVSHSFILIKDEEGDGGISNFKFMFKGTMKFLTMGFVGWEWDSNPMRIQLAI